MPQLVRLSNNVLSKVHTKVQHGRDHHSYSHLQIPCTPTHCTIVGRRHARDTAAAGYRGPGDAQRTTMEHAQPLGLTLGALMILTVIFSASPSLAGSLELLSGPVQGTALGESQLAEGFVQGLLLIFFSELGDKTFFIALLLAVQRPKSLVFAGTFGALVVMTAISVGLGQFLHGLDEIIPQTGGFPWDDAIAVALLLVFGVQTIAGAKDASVNAAEEKEEAAGEVAVLTSASAGLLASTFALVFAAEWGDKSFLATIALAAASSPLGVTCGAITGHGIATALAVLGGQYLSKNVSEETLQYGGGILFIAFAIAQTVDIVNKVM